MTSEAEQRRAHNVDVDALAEVFAEVDERLAAEDAEDADTA